MVWQKCMVAKVKRSMSHNGYINENMCIEFGVIQHMVYLKLR